MWPRLLTRKEWVGSSLARSIRSRLMSEELPAACLVYGTITSMTTSLDDGAGLAFAGFALKGRNDAVLTPSRRNHEGLASVTMRRNVFASPCWTRGSSRRL